MTTCEWLRMTPPVVEERSSFGTFSGFRTYIENGVLEGKEGICCVEANVIVGAKEDT